MGTPNQSQLPSLLLPSRFQNPSIVGQGRYSCVYHAHDSHLEREVAIKVIFHAVGAEERSRIVARNEVASLSKLNHPNIIRLLDVIRLNEATLIVQPFCSNGAASSVSESKSSYSERVAMIESLLQANQYLHQQGWIHCDIKPSNILINHRGVAILSDFGEAREYVSSGDVAELIGSVGYMAPEILRGVAGPSIRTEMYSLGVSIFELLTRDRASSDDTLLAIQSTLKKRVRSIGTKIPQSNDWNAIIAKASSPIPGDRYSTVQELLNDVVRIRESLPVSVRQPSFWEMLRRWIGKEPITASLLFSVIATLIFGSVTSFSAWVIASRNLTQNEEIQRELDRLAFKSAEAQKRLKQAVDAERKEAKEAERLEKEASEAVSLASSIHEKLDIESAESARLNEELQASIEKLENSKREQARLENDANSVLGYVLMKEQSHQQAYYDNLIGQAYARIESSQFERALELLEQTEHTLRRAEYYWLRGLAIGKSRFPKRTDLGSISIDDEPAHAKFAFVSPKGQYFVRSTKKMLKILSVSDSVLSSLPLPPFGEPTCEIEVQFNDDQTELIALRMGRDCSDWIFARRGDNNEWAISGEPTKSNNPCFGITSCFRNSWMLYCIESKSNQLLTTLIDAKTSRERWKKEITIKGTKSAMTSPNLSARIVNSAWFPHGVQILVLPDRSSVLIVDEESGVHDRPVSFGHSSSVSVIKNENGLELMDFSKFQFAKNTTQQCIVKDRMLSNSSSATNILLYSKNRSQPIPLAVETYKINPIRVDDDLRCYGVVYSATPSTKVEPNSKSPVATLLAFDFGIDETDDLRQLASPLTKSEVFSQIASISNEKEGSIVGTVRNRKGNAIPNAYVSLGEQHVVSDRLGEYRFDRAKAGPKELRAEAAGFRAHEVSMNGNVLEATNVDVILDTVQKIRLRYSMYEVKEGYAVEPSIESGEFEVLVDEDRVGLSKFAKQFESTSPKFASTINNGSISMYCSSGTVQMTGSYGVTMFATRPKDIPNVKEFGKVKLLGTWSSGQLKNGSFVFASVLQGLYFIKFEIVSLEDREAIVANELDTESKTLGRNPRALSDENRFAYGKVTDNRGVRLPGAKIVMGNSEVTSGKFGEYRIQIPMGDELRLKFLHPGYIPVEIVSSGENFKSMQTPIHQELIPIRMMKLHYNCFEVNEQGERGASLESGKLDVLLNKETVSLSNLPVAMRRFQSFSDQNKLCLRVDRNKTIFQMSTESAAQFKLIRAGTQQTASNACPSLGNNMQLEVSAANSKSVVFVLWIESLKDNSTEIE